MPQTARRFAVAADARGPPSPYVTTGSCDAPTAPNAARMRSLTALRMKRLSSIKAVFADAWTSPDSASKLARTTFGLLLSATERQMGLAFPSVSMAAPVAIWLRVFPMPAKVRSLRSSVSVTSLPSPPA